MNRFFRKLPLASKLLLIALVPLALMQYLAFQFYQQEKQNVDMLRSYVEKIYQSALINQLIDALQNERKFSFDYAMKITDRQSLLRQRPKTDSIIRQLETNKDYAVKGFKKYTFLDQLPQMRATIDTGHVAPDVVMSYYSNSIFRLSYIYNIPSVNNAYLQPVYEELVDQKILSQMVTFLGVIRSNFYNVLYTRQNGLGTLYGLSGIYEVYKTYEKEFTEKASPNLLRQYENARKNTGLNATLQYIDDRFKYMSFDSSYSAEQWWEVSDKAISQLQALQTNLRTTIERNLSAISTREIAQERLIIALLAASLVLVTLVVAYTIWVLTKTLNELKGAAKKISVGRKIVPFKDMPEDVIGSLASCIQQLSSNNDVLAEAANQIGKGNFEVDVTPRSSEDVLGNAIVHMKKELQEFTHQLSESRERFKQLADAMPQIVWTAEPDGVTDYYNKRWYEFTGFDEQRKNQNWLEILHPDDRQFCLKTWNNAVKTGEPYSIEYRFRDRKSSTYRWFLGKAIPFKDSEGNITKWFGTCTDIEDQKMFAVELEHKVEERTRELQRSNKDLEQFAYIASHDLQEPLRKMSMFADFIKQNGYADMNDSTKTYLDKIVASADRMRTIIKDLLDFSHLNNSPDQFSLVNLNIVIENVMSDLELMIQQKNATIRYDRLPEIEAIPVQMNQLFYNLMNNALKFSHPDRKPVIEITESKPDELIPKTADPYTGFLKISFKDNGIGFEQQYALKIFDMFQQLNDKQTYGGTGIGLALCKKIVENHNGSISARSTPGEGAEFDIALPVMQSQREKQYTYKVARKPA